MVHVIKYLHCIGMTAAIERVHGLTNQVSHDRDVTVSIETLKQRAMPHKDDNFMIKIV